MSGHPFLQAIQNRKNLIHTMATVAPHDTVKLGSNGLYNLKGNQAINLNVQHRYHDINPQTTVSAFTASAYQDFKIPEHLHVIDKMSLYMTLANSDGALDWEADLPTEFWVRRVELIQGGEVKQTIEPIDLYLRHSVFKNYEELQHQEARNGLDPSTFQGDATATTIQELASAEFSLDLETVLDQCHILVAGLSKEITLRVYYEAIANFSDSAQNADITISSTKLRIREQYYSPPDLQRMLANYRSKDIDHKLTVPVIETTTTTLTGSTNNKYITKNYDGELCPVMFVIVRNMSDIDANSDAFVQVSTLYLEDQSGQNLNNGIAWKDADLRNYVYPAYFPNNMSQSSGNKYVYAFVNCLDPVSAVVKSVNTGYNVLPKNFRLVLNPSGTLTSHQVDIVAYVYRHVRVSGGLIKMY